MLIPTHKILRLSPPLTSVAVASHFHVTLRTARRWLEAMAEAGVIESIGEPVRGRTTGYRLCPKGQQIADAEKAGDLSGRMDSLEQRVAALESRFVGRLEPVCDHGLE